MTVLNGLLKHRRKLVVAGIIAPFLYLSQVIILGLLEPGFNQRTMMMSILGGVRGWRGAAFNLGLIMIALLLVLFGIGMHLAFNRGRSSRVGLILLIVACIGLVGSSYFHCDVACLNILDEPDFRGQMHMMFAFIAGLSLAFSPLAFYLSMKEEPQWKVYRRWTLIAVILSNIPGITMWISLFTVRLPEWEGLIQRLGLFFPLIWVEVTAIKLLRIMNNDHNEAD